MSYYSSDTPSKFGWDSPGISAMVGGANAALAYAFGARAGMQLITAAAPPAVAALALDLSEEYIKFLSKASGAFYDPVLWITPVVAGISLALAVSGGSPTQILTQAFYSANAMQIGVGAAGSLAALFLGPMIANEIVTLLAGKKK